MPATPSKDIVLARKQWNKCAESEDAQRKRIVAAKKFRALDQWPAAIKIAREGGGSLTGQAPQPARPCLVVDRLSQPTRQVSNMIKNADFGYDVLPNGMGADTETAEIFKGYLRRMQNQARGESPVEWAADGAIEGGIGWFRLRSDFVHKTWDGPLTEEAFDQELYEERITNNLTVYCDPSAMSPTRRDAKFMFVTEDIDRDEFEETYDAECCAGLDEFLATGDMQGWVSNDVVRIAEWWRVTYRDRPMWWLRDGTIVEQAPKDKDAIRMHRVMRSPVVKGCKINALGVLKKKGGEKEEWDWPGCRIPLFPVLGEELNVDGKVVLRGIIEMGMDAQRMVNYTYSAGVEIFALASKKAPMIPGAAVQNYQSIWNTRNIVNHSYLPYDPWDNEGRQLPAPIFDSSEAPIQAAVALMQVSEDAIKASTSTGDASLGNTNPNERSGRALEALQNQSDLANSNYPDNVKRALIEAAQEAVYIIPKITRPGQIVHIMGMDDEPQQVMVGKPFKEGPNGIPEPAGADVTPEMAKIQGSLYKFYDLNNGTYAVTVTVGKAEATRRQEGSQALGELIPHLPPEMQMKVMPDYIKQLSFPGAQAIAEKLEPPSEIDALPPQAQAIVQQLQQQNQQLQQLANDNMAKLQIAQAGEQAESQREQLKQQAEDQRAQRDAAVKLEIAKMDNATKLQIEELKLKGLAMQAELDAREAALGAQQQRESQAHEAGMAAMGQAGQSAEAERGRQHEGAEADAGRAHESEEARTAREAAAAEAEAGRGHEAEMAQRAAQNAAKTEQA